jgi:hypothetical protein
MTKVVPLSYHQSVKRDGFNVNMVEAKKMMQFQEIPITHFFEIDGEV